MNYNYNYIVSTSEANALKEMIFKRAQERANVMTDDVHAEIMDIARNSFVSNNNPFSQIASEAKVDTFEKTVNNTKESVSSEITEKQNPADNAEPAIGFAQKTPTPRATEQSRIVNEQVLAQTIQSNMNDARNSLSNKKSFIGALNFLNSQAVASLMYTKSHKFEAIA